MYELAMTSIQRLVQPNKNCTQFCTILHDSLNGENLQELGKIADRFRGIYRIYLELLKKNPKDQNM